MVFVPTERQLASYSRCVYTFCIVLQIIRLASSAVTIQHQVKPENLHFEVSLIEAFLLSL